MSEETQVVESQPEIVPVPEVKEFRYEYQPKDENGNPIGNKQVVVATSPEEAVEKIAGMHGESIKLTRRLKRDLRIGHIVEENIPDDAPRVKKGQYEFQAQPMTAEERLEVIRDINDPENFDRAATRLVKATIGDPVELRSRIEKTEQQVAQMYAKEQAQAFIRSSPEYYVCGDNFETLANWMIKNDLEPTKANFKLAFKTLGPEGENVMLLSPQPEPVIEEPKPEPAPTPTPVAAPRPLTSGLTRKDASESSSSAPKEKYTKTDIERMSGEEYKRKLQSEKGFKQIVDKIYATPAARTE